MEANKNKLINKNVSSVNAVKRDDRFDKLEEFKLFPNKKNSSIYEPSSASKVSTSRSKYDDKSFEFNRNSLNSSDNRRSSMNTEPGLSAFGSMANQYKK